MQVEQLLGTNPNDSAYVGLIRDACAAQAHTRMQAALAYATQSGVAELCRRLGDVPGWQGLRKQWMIGIDYCRSDPQALSHLEALPQSEVRIFDGAFVSRREGCAPRVSYHPKLYIFSGGAASAAVVGSGNLSQTGLRVGVEAAASVRGTAQGITPIRLWYRRLWRTATPLANIELDYVARYSARPNRERPAPVEDDIVPVGSGARGQLTPVQLRQLRVCQHLWIEAGNLHANRGIGQPGNQLMLKRNSRVFFGFPAKDLEPDTAIGSVSVRYQAFVRPDCSLRFSNNSMDVITLPIPGQGGPAAYDQEVLLFKRTGVRTFDLAIGTAAQAAAWRRSSERIDASFVMSSGRAWGVF
jgi:hypothetical protein